jgi:hypothetical protein
MSSSPGLDKELKRVLDEKQEPATRLEKENQEAAAELSASDKNGELSMDVKVYSPFKNYFEGKAFSVSAENLTGPFDILPRHHNFISLLSASALVIRSKKGEEKIEISGGIMHVKADKLIVFLDV